MTKIRKPHLKKSPYFKLNFNLDTHYLSAQKRVSIISIIPLILPSLLGKAQTLPM